MAVAYEESHNTLFSSNMNPHHQQMSNNFHQVQQGYFDPSQMYYPPPGQYFPQSPVFQPFHHAGPPQFLPPSQDFSNNSLGRPPQEFYGQAMNQPVNTSRGRGGRRGGGARPNKGRQNNNPSKNPSNNPSNNPNKPPKQETPVSENSDTVDEYLKSYIDGVFDYDQEAEKDYKNKSREVLNKHKESESKIERGGNYQRQRFDQYSENDDRHASHHGGRGRYERSKSSYDHDRQSFSARNKNAGNGIGRQNKTYEKKNGGKFDKNVGSNNAEFKDQQSEEIKQNYRDKHFKSDGRQQFDGRRGQRSGRGRPPNQGRMYQGRQLDDDYDPQNEMTTSNNSFHDKEKYSNRDKYHMPRTSGSKGHDLQNEMTTSNNSFHDKEKYSNRDKYHMPRTSGSKGQGRRPYIARTLSGKVDESQRGVLIDQLTNNAYECMVCCETVRCQNAVWNCSNCFHLFHLRCVKKWARSSAVVDENEDNGWRCPACQNKCDKFPSQYRCFCGKVRDPEFNRMEIPHSCGEMCGKKRGHNCVHPCNILCHPGPCPPCNAVISRSCDCGKTSQTMKCSATQIIKCEEKCGKQLNCGKHFCKVTCHAGSCSMCEEVLVQECYKGHTSREVVCGTKESFQTSFSCNAPCQKILECGNHTCEEICHEDPCSECKLSPQAVTTCPCGSTPLADLSSTPRTNCLDPVPTCGGICNKTLSCGPSDDHHTCKLSCHEGECGPCPGESLLKCRCGAIEKLFPCTEAPSFTEENPFCCDKRCNKKRKCGRHKCGQMCCVLEKEDHLCDLICGKKLSCGLHKCDELCHRGNCHPCLLASFEELTCYCGSEIRYPPIPCGTLPPVCSKKCTRTHSCSHPVRHTCHSDESCPPCTELTSKYCMGNHELRKNIPCHINNISCGLPCEKSLPCGTHKCTRTCHKGDCEEDGKSCVQPCSVPRPICGHPCGVPCHSGQDCPPVPCRAEIIIKCPCGRKTGRQLCNAGGSSPELEEYQKITVQALASTVGSGQSVDMSNITSAARKVSKRQLECDGDCAIMERNRRMALALEIKNPDLSAKLGNPSYSDFLKEYARNNPQNVAAIDKSFSNLVQNAKGSKHPHRSHQFPPMNRDQRRVVHELAEFYGCETQSYDLEPKKNVVATAYKEKCWLPSVTLTALIQRELHPKAPTPIPHVHDEEALRKSSSAAKQSTSLLPGQSTKPVAWAPRETTHTVLKKNTKAEKQIDYFDFSED